MGVITSVRRNVKNAGRCSVFVDDVFFAACPIDVALALGLRKGLEMSAELERRLRAEDRRMVLRQKAYRFATYKPRTERDLRRFLDKAEATEEESADVLSWLSEFRLVDDAEYARRFIEASKLRKPLSPSMMRRTLLGKGLSELVVEEAMADQTSAGDALLAARSVARKKLRMITSEDVRLSEDKLVRFLQYRGYTWEVIKNVIAEWKSGALVALFLLVTSNLPAASQIDTSCDKVRLSDAINKFQPATLPIMGPDGKLYFDRKFHPDNPDGGSADADQVWASRLRNGQWENPSTVDISVIDPRTGRRTAADVVFGFSADNLRALLAGRFVAGSNSMALVLAHRTTADGPFLSHQLIVADLGRNFYATFSDDGSVIIVAMQRSSGEGDLDLYRITNNACGVVSEPAPLSDALNTASFDGAPWLGCDSRTLYFASAGREDRRGKADLYMSRRLDETWTRWSDPVNLGPCINTTEDETSISLSCESAQAFFTSWDATSERAGIYTAALADSLLPSTMLRTTVVFRDVMADTIIKGLHILEASSGADPCAQWRGWPLDSRTGQAILLLAADRSTPLRIGSDPRWQMLGVEMDSSQSRSASITAYMIALDKPICSIRFAKADTVLSEQARATLQALKKRLGAGSLSRLRVVGWADASGSDVTNLAISRARARAVAAEVSTLISDRPAERITIEGRGVEVIGSRTTSDDAPESRRVDVYAEP